MATDEQPEPPANDWVEVMASTLDVTAAAAFVGTPASGASVVFLGTVRDHAPGRTGVTHLEYEAYEGVVEPKIEAVVAEVRDEEARQALACQVIEEAKHVAVFQRLLRKLDAIHPPSFFARRLLTDLLKTDGVVFKMVGMHLFVENLALHSFQTIKEHVEDPLVQEVVDYVARDERKHVALGAIYVPPLLEELSDRPFSSSGCAVGTSSASVKYRS